jgi:hypothetical protein
MFQGGWAMDSESAPLVAGLFRSYDQAEEARRELCRLGLADEAIEARTPEPGSYQVEYYESRELGRGLIIGTAIGIPVGSVIAVGVLMATVPSLSTMAAIGLGILVGSYWGLFFGGLGGMVTKVVAQAHGADRRTIAADSRETLLIAEVGSQTDSVHQVMRRHGARCFLEGVTSHQQLREPLALAS